jgi:hypothetical protein
VTSRLQFTTTEGCPDTFDRIVYIRRPMKFGLVKKMTVKKEGDLINAIYKIFLNIYCLSHDWLH